jgi:RHH-type proline utilization regulon transcriptional repressor/proline dehydrogenase/delta 1-pyrroline-5-carboxylate dehydrogenase
LVAALLARACWAAGIPDDVLGFVPCRDDDAGRRLITHPDVDAVILTGAWDTARMFLGWRPDLRLHAETSGKNAIVITATADLDAAVADLVRSAFGHAGQKCSAASLAIVEAAVYDDPGFRRQLADAVTSLRVGPAWDPATVLGPLIRPPSGPLAHHLSHLEGGEEWLVAPRGLDDAGYLWSPGVKLGVQPGSSYHLTECFGPILGVMRAADLDQAIAWQNQPPYGLTAGLQALDPAEIAHWRDRVEAGNLYVNRHITGAIVGRQPFGGWKRSVVGPGAKAGGPNYVAMLGSHDAEARPGADTAAACGQAWTDELRNGRELAGLAPEANVLRYRPLHSVLLRVGPGVAADEVAVAVAAANAVGTNVETSDAAVETDDELAARLPPVDKVRFLGAVSDLLRRAALDAGLWVDQTPVIADARRELLRWVREQALSESRHRYGNVTSRRPGPLQRAP